MIGIKIEDNVSPYFQKLMKVSPDAVNEALGRSGNKVRNKMMSLARNSGRANTGFSYSTSGRRRLVSSDEGGNKQLFSRFDHTTGDREKIDMAEHIRFRVYDKTHKVLVGFLDTKSYNPIKYRKGKKVGYFGRKKGVFVKKIGQLYEYGGKVDLTQKQKAFFKASGWGKVANKGSIEKKPHPVVNRAWSSSKSEALDTFKKVFMEVIEAQ